MGVLSDLFGGKHDDNSRKYLDEAGNAVDKIADPKLNTTQYTAYDNVGNYTPEQIKAAQVAAGQDVGYTGVDPRLSDSANVDGTAMSGVSTDPRLKANQMSALDSLSNVANSGGMTAADKATLNKIQTDTSAADRGRRDAILQNMGARGMGGSGNELLAQLSSSQAATDQANQSGLTVAGQAQQRALDAMLQSGQLSGQMQAQDFSQQSDVAKAKDAINQFNAANTLQNNQYNAGAANAANQFNASNTLQNAQNNRATNVGVGTTNANFANSANQFNAGAANTAKASNATNAQNTSNLNTGLTNTAAAQPNALAQQAFDNSMTKANAKNGVLGQKSAAETAAGDREAAAMGGLIGTGAQAGAKAYASSDKSVKSDIKGISDAEIDEFLGAVSPKKFKYKDPSADGQAPGQRVGFIAQDVKDTKLGKDLVSNDANGKLQYDKDNLNGILLAALSKLAKDN